MTPPKGPLQDEPHPVLEEILRILERKTGVNFCLYKPTTLQRRVVRRMNLLNVADEAAYLALLQRDEQEQHHLYKEMLIHVTSFFRDETSFDYLCSHVIPAILAEKGPEDIVRIWVCGCATGEEAYSIAMCFHEHLKHSGDLARIKIFASDLSETAIARARNAVFPKAATARLSERRIQEYFDDYRGKKQLKGFIRDMCVFAVHNVLSDPPFANLDLVSCRNVLIYMKPALQKKVLATFSYALRRNGYLFLGKSENSGLGGKFEAVNKSANIYFNKEPNKKLFSSTLRTGASQKEKEATEPIKLMERKDFQRAADDLLLSRYIPAGIVVNDTFDIVDFRGNTGFYIDPSPGAASLNALKIIRKGLYFDLQEILHRVKTEKVPVHKPGIALEHDGRLLRISIEAQPLSGTREKYYLVLFRDSTPEKSGEPVVSDGINNTKDLRIHQLEQELMQSRDQLRALSEEQEATNEEFQSANEELKTLNEELQTSQEELISINEEMSIRNRELNERNRQISQNEQFIQSILNTVSDCLLVLDKDLRIRTANATFYKKFGLDAEQSEGSYLYEVGNKEWNLPELRRTLTSVLPEHRQLDNYRMELHSEKAGRRILMLNARQVSNREAGEPMIFLSVDDITESSRISEAMALKQEQLIISEERQRLAIAAARMGTWDYDLLSHQVILSDETRFILGLAKKEQQGFNFLFDLIHPEDREEAIRAIERALMGNREMIVEREFRIQPADGGATRWIYFVGKTLLSSTRSVVRFTGVVNNISEKKQMEQDLRETASRLGIAMTTGRIGSWELDTATMQMQCSEQCKVNFGLKPETTCTPAQLMDMILPSDREEIAAGMADVIENGKPFRTEYRISWPDESIHWIAVSGTVEPAAGGKGKRMMGISIDITERKSLEQKLKHSELHFRTLVSGAPLMISMSDADGVFNFFNREWLSFTGRNETDLSGNWQADIHPEDLSGFNTLYRASLKERSKFVTGFRMKHEGGQYRRMSCIAVPRFNMENELDGYTMACTDLDECAVPRPQE